MKGSRTKAVSLFEVAVVLAVALVYVYNSVPFSPSVSGYQTAPTTATVNAEATESYNGDVIYIVAEGSTEHYTIMGITEYTDDPVFVVGDDGFTSEQFELLRLQYSGAAEFVTVGGVEAYGEDGPQIMEDLHQVVSFIEDSAGIDILETTIAGPTGADTAALLLNAYAPDAEEINIVHVEGTDGSLTNEDIEMIALAGQDAPVLLVYGDEPSATTMEALADHPVPAEVTIVSFDPAVISNTEDDLAALEGAGEITGIETISGEPEQIINELEQQFAAEVQAKIAAGEDVEIIFAEIGEEMPIPQPGQEIFFYEDENNDGRDDDVPPTVIGSDNPLAQITAPDFIIDAIEDGQIHEVTFTGDNQQVLENIADHVEEASDGAVDTSVSTDPIGTVTEHLEENVEAIEDISMAREDEIRDNYADHLDEFREHSEGSYAQLQAFINTPEYDELSQGIQGKIAELVEEFAKGDYAVAFELGHEIEGDMFDYYYDTHYEEFHDDAAFRQELVEESEEGIDEAVEGLVGDASAGLSDLEKIEVFGISTDFVLPDQADEVADEVIALAQSVPPTELGDAIFEAVWEEPAADAVETELRAEFAAVGEKYDADQIDLSSEIESRALAYAKAYAGGFLPEGIETDNEARQEFYKNFDSMAFVLESEGVQPYALPPETAEKAYKEYLDNGKLSEAIIKESEAVYTATRAYESANPGEAFYYDPGAFAWNADINTVSFYDAGAGRYVEGFYNDLHDKFAYNSDGMLHVGSGEGEVNSYSSTYAVPGFTGWTSEDGVWTNPTGYTYEPPVYKNDEGAYAYAYTNPDGSAMTQYYSGSVFEYDPHHEYVSYYDAVYDETSGSAEATYTGTFAYDPTQGYSQVQTEKPVGAVYDSVTHQYSYASVVDGEEQTYYYNPYTGTYYDSSGNVAGQTSYSGYGGTYHSPDTSYTPPGYTYDQYYSGTSSTSGTSGTGGTEYHSAPTYTYTDTTSAGYTGAPATYSYTDPATGETHTSTSYDTGSTGGTSGGTTTTSGGTTTTSGGTYDSGGYTAPSGGEAPH